MELNHPDSQAILGPSGDLLTLQGIYHKIVAEECGAYLLLVHQAVSGKLLTLPETHHKIVAEEHGAKFLLTH